MVRHSKRIGIRFCLILAILIVALTLTYIAKNDCTFAVTPSSNQSGLIRRSASRQDVAKEKNVNYAIFDAKGYTGTLEFLNVIGEEWRVLVVNLNDKSRLSTCESCFRLYDHSSASTILKKWGILLQEIGIESNGRTLLAAILFVLSQGANWIYVTNRPVPIPYKAFTRVIKREFNAGLVYQGHQSVFEPCGHFMDPFTWNGLGVQHIGNHYNVKEVSFDSLFYVINECFREGMSQQNWQDSFDTKAPIPYTMPGTYATIDFSNVLVSKPNVWALIASAFPENEKNTSSLQINLMIQRILWETSSNVGFLPSEHNVGHVCPTCNIQTRLENAGKGYLSNLTRWRCPSSHTVFECIAKLSKQNIISGGERFQQLITLWFFLLENIGWVSNKRYAYNDGRAKERFTGIPVYFTPAKSLHNKTLLHDTRPPNSFKNVCGKMGSPYQAKIPQQHKDAFEDVLLIVITNRDLVGNISHTEYAYGRHFKRIIYCSQNMRLFEKEFEMNFNVNPVTYIERDVHEGYFGHRCIETIMKIGYDVKGYLHISDDLLLNVWNLPSLPYDVPWFQSNLRVADIYSNQATSGVYMYKNWGPWTFYYGQNASLKVFKDLHNLTSSPTDGGRVSKFLTNISNFTRCDHCLLYETSDIFYVPRRMIVNFNFFSQIFSRNDVFLELVIPTILIGLTSEREVYRLRGNYAWFKDRSLFMFTWKEFDHFYHPFKFTQRLNMTDGVKFYCNHFLSKINSDLRM